MSKRKRTETIENDNRLCVFKPVVNEKKLLTWQSKLLHKLNTSKQWNNIITCSTFFNKLDEMLTQLGHCEAWNERLSLDIKRTRQYGNSTVYLLETPVRGLSASSVYIFTKINVTRCVGQFGEYLRIQWRETEPFHIACTMALQKHLDCLCIVQPHYNYNVSDDSFDKSVLARQFFRIPRDLNSAVFMTGKLNETRPLKTIPFDVSTYNDTLLLNHSVEFMMGAIIEGVREHIAKEKITQLNNNKAIDKKTYTLGLKSMLFFKSDD
ncbi:dbp-1 [Hyposidra talaca nucleopolyhedrovirus]|uniref:Dbp-1 n=1 Tax=Hyposidra talaca nucleopolyhedrovirus TaxID=1070315 RepID=A0A2Z4HHX3_9ABAC|nr:dbp-1 [Hyposidra talaca nucleopolyhedrovirus]AWW14373.1 dbp-1 [Hyposidra talaca nucleopolyhedrovirus]